MKTNFSFSVFILLVLSFHTNAQNDSIKTERYTAHNRGKITISWGGNRDKFTNSDIRFKGNDYDFIIDNAVSHDKPQGWHVNYITPDRMTIPQTNVKLGYFISDHYSVSVGIDHMKYVMAQNQTANITGIINGNPLFNGIYTTLPTILTEDFLKFEHTDGLNYVYTEIARQDDISIWFGIKNTDKFQVNVNEGFGIGILCPKTNTTLLGKERHDDYHFSGYGTSIKAGINLTIFKYFTIEGAVKGGYINMPNIRTTASVSDSASQHFFFSETIIAFGGIFRV